MSIEEARAEMTRMTEQLAELVQAAVRVCVLLCQGDAEDQLSTMLEPVLEPEPASRPQGGLTKRPVYLALIVEVLRELGGRAQSREVLRVLEARLAGQFTPRDLEIGRDGMPTWRNRAHWARFKLKQQGILKSDSPPGVWVLAESRR